MDTVTALSPSDAYRQPVDRSRRNNRHVRVLRWTFRRDAEDAVAASSRELDSFESERVTVH